MNGNVNKHEHPPVPVLLCLLCRAWCLIELADARLGYLGQASISTQPDDKYDMTLYDFGYDLNVNCDNV